MANDLPLASRRIGIDIGRVLIGSDSDEPGSAGVASMFGPDFLEAPAVPGGLSSLGTLVRLAGAVHLVSKCGPKVQHNTQLWLDAHDVYASIGLARANVHFVRERAEKGPEASRLGLDTFIDDRLEVLGGMPATVQTRILFGIQKVRTLPSWVLPALDWPAALSAIEPESGAIRV